MKRSMLLLTTTALAVLVSACGEGERTGQPPAADAPANAPAATTRPVADPVTFAPAPAVDPDSAPRVRCALDSVNGQKARANSIAVEAGSPLRFKGWVADTAKRAPASFTILLSGPQAYAADGSTGGRRADVARAHKAKGLADSGFDVATLLGTVAPGDYEVTLLVDAKDDKARCATTTRIIVGSNS